MSSALIERGFHAGNEAHVKIVRGIPSDAKLIGASCQQWRRWSLATLIRHLLKKHVAAAAQ